jgi:hypothetical protein
LYGCETLSLTPREEHGFQGVSEQVVEEIICTEERGSEERVEKCA